MSLKLPTLDKGKAWTLRVVRQYPRLDGKDLWGYCNTLKREIVVCKKVQKDGVAREVVMHEALHAFLPWLDEAAVDQLAKNLDEVLDVVEGAGILEL